MNTILNIINFLGVLVLVGLAAAQWKDNSRLNSELDRREQTGLEQVARLSEQDKAIRGYASDLDDARQKLAKSDASLKDTSSKLAAMTAERNKLEQQRDQLSTLRDQLNATLDQWKAAVTQRDAVIKQNNEQIQKLAADRHDAEQKYSDLIKQYNNVVNQLNARNKQ
jgi:chromosome segregation ATPase